MGECGCGEFYPDKVYRVRDLYLGLQYYLACDNCKTPVGVVAYLMDEIDAAHWDMVERAREWPRKSEVFLPFFDHNCLVKAAQVMDVDLEAHLTLADLLTDHGLDLVRKAFEIYREERKLRWVGGGSGK